MDTNPTSRPASPLILMIDDNQDAALTLSMLLRLNGYQVHVCYSGRAGIQVAEELHPSHVICDIGMPEPDGYATCRAIRGQAWGQPMKLIALTGYGQADDIQKTHQAGFDAHVVKPVDLDVLLTLLKNAS